MPEPVPIRYQVEFGPFTADLRTGELFKYGNRIKLQDRPFYILSMLLEHPGQVVTREEMRARLWPDGTFVDFDNNISSAIGKLRTGLGDSAASPRYIETVGRGYRFAGEVTLVSAPTQPLPEAPPEPVVISGRAVPRSGRPRWIRIAVVAVIVATAGLIAYFRWWRSPTSLQPARTKVMLAVLPFTNLTGDTGQEYFSDGFTEEMITQLGRLDSARVGVIARTSVMPYKNRQEQLDRIGRDLGVQYVLEGSIRRDSNHVRITAQLIQVRDQTHLLAREYDRELKDVLVLQNEIAQEIADEIQLAFSDRKKPELAARQPSLTPQAYEAYDLYLKGRYFWNKRTAQGFRQAIECFQQAIARDPNYARAYAGLADSYALMSSYFFGPQDELTRQARTAALKALQIDDGLAEAHTSLALISEDYDWDWQTAEKEFRRAIQLDANYATAHQWYAEFLAFQGRFDEAFAESERARQLDPLSLIITADHAAILLFSRQYDPAIQELRRVLDMDSNLSRAQSLLTVAYTQQGRFEEALKVTDGFERYNDGAWAWAARSSIYARAGQLQQARQALAKAEMAVRRQPLDPSPILIAAYAAMGQKDQAFAWLEKAYLRHSAVITTLKVDPSYDPLRGDPRFQDLLRRVGLNP